MPEDRDSQALQPRLRRSSLHSSSDDSGRVVGSSEVGQKQGSGKCLPDSPQKTSRKGGQVNPGAAATKTVSKQGFTPDDRKAKEWISERAEML